MVNLLVVVLHYMPETSCLSDVFMTNKTCSSTHNKEESKDLRVNWAYINIYTICVLRRLQALKTTKSNHHPITPPIALSTSARSPTGRKSHPAICHSDSNIRHVLCDHLYSLHANFLPCLSISQSQRRRSFEFGRRSRLLKDRLEIFSRRLQ